MIDDYELEQGLNITDRTSETISMNRSSSISQEYYREYSRVREQSIAITKIEEAMMWANAAIRRDNARIQDR